MVRFDFNWKNIGISFILALALATIFNIILTKQWGVQALPLGVAWIVVLISVFIVYFFVAAGDGKIERKEIITMIVLAGVLFFSGWALKNYLPEIFSVLPDATKQLFSSLGVN